MLLSNSVGGNDPPEPSPDVAGLVGLILDSARPEDRQQVAQKLREDLGLVQPKENPNADLISSLRELADYLESNPFPKIWFPSIYASAGVDTKEEVLAVIKTCRGPWKKEFDKDKFRLRHSFGPIGELTVFVNRDQICVAKKVKKIVPARPELVLPATPEREEESIEWECPQSILQEVTEGG